MDRATMIMHTHKICKVVAAPSGRELFLLSSKQRGRPSAYSAFAAAEPSAMPADPVTTVRCWTNHCSCSSFLALARATSETVLVRAACLPPAPALSARWLVTTDTLAQRTVLLFVAAQCEHMLAVQLSLKMQRVEDMAVPDADFWKWACPECIAAIADCI